MTRPRILARGLLAVFVVAGLVAGAALVPSLVSVRAAPPLQAATHVVISEFRSRGPGGTGDEFIELFNPTNASVSIDGWTLWKSAGCVTTGNSRVYTFPSGLSLAAGQHYLIGGLDYSGTVSSDVLPLVAIVLDDNGGLALFDAASTIVDQVGMCNTTSFFEGTPLTRLSGASNQSYDRISDATSGACVDTDNNAADFFLRRPSDPQNSSSPLTKCGNPTPIPPTPTPIPRSGDVIINEVGWGGTQAAAADQWIELYNTTSSDIDLTNWSLRGPAGKIGGTSGILLLTGTIHAQDYYVIATSTSVFKGSIVDKEDSHLKLDGCSDCGDWLTLENVSYAVIDTANHNGGQWPAGKIAGRASMERDCPAGSDTPNTWLTYAGTPPSGGVKDSAGNLVRGTPGQENWSCGVTITPSPVPTSTRKPTPIPPMPYAHMVINEFLPRAGFDWNGDGTVDVYDEFIEIKNLGPVDGNLRGWKLDAVSDTSYSYTLPSLTLKPGQRALYYGSTTHILLHDSGATVRLTNPSGYIIDARGYGVVDYPDQSWCRIPDGAYWTHPCFPTPGTENSLTGTVPGPPPNAVNLPPVCLLADTVPDAFRQAECDAFGADMLNPAYWDDQAGQGEFAVPDAYTKWHTLVQ